MKWPIWSINMDAFLRSDGYYPYWELHWEVTDAANGKAANGVRLDTQALGQGPLALDYLLKHANYQFHKFFEKHGEEFAQKMDNLMIAQASEEQRQREDIARFTEELPDVNDTDPV